MAEPASNPMHAEPEHSDGNTADIGTHDETRAPVMLDPSRWIERYGDSLWRYAMAKSRDAQAAEDLVQDTLVTALAAAARFEGRSAELTWLTGILKHKLMEHYRRTKRQPEQLDADNPASRFNAAGHWAQLPGRITADGAGDDGQNELLGRLGVCREQLPPTLLEPLELREVQGLSGEAICAALQLSTSALWTRLHRAREALRNCLEKSAKAASDAFAGGRSGKGNSNTTARTGGTSEIAS